MNGLQLSGLSGKRRNLSAGQYKGRLGNYVHGGVAGLGQINYEDYSRQAQDAARRARQAAERHYVQGNQWLTNVYDQAVSMNIDTSLVDWENLAAKSLDVAVNWLTKELSVSPVKTTGDAIYDIDSVSGAQAVEIFRRTFEYEGSLTPEEKANAAVLTLMRARQRTKSREAQDTSTQSTRRRSAPRPVVSSNTSRFIVLGALAAVGATAIYSLYLR
jgi:hypothetical protein